MVQEATYTISWGPALDYYAILLKKIRWIRLNKELFLYSINKGSGEKHMLSVVGKRAFPLIEKLFSVEAQYEFPELINPEFAKRMGVFETLQEQGVDIGSFSYPNVYESRKRHFEQSYSWNLSGTSRTKASLRYSIWNRDPTNDLRVIQFCLSVPEEQFVQNGLDRALIRRATEGFLPDKIRLNQRVRGIQGADGMHRMTPSWDTFIAEIQQLITFAGFRLFKHKGY